MVGTINGLHRAETVGVFRRDPSVTSVAGSTARWVLRGVTTIKGTQRGAIKGVRIRTPPTRDKDANSKGNNRTT